MKDIAPLAPRARYKIANSVLRMCQHLNLAPGMVCSRAGLPVDICAGADPGVSAQQCFALWSAIQSQAQRPNMPLEFARHAARTGFVPAVFAFACSPSVAIGLDRLATFKPLVGPILLTSRLTRQGLIIDIRSSDPALPFPASFATFELVCLIELLATYTGDPIAPLKVSAPADPTSQPALDHYLGVPVTPGPHVSLLLPASVAARPLLSQDPSLWAVFEPELRRQLTDFETHEHMAARVRKLLLELLPSGQSALGLIAERLNLSKRSLNRRLSDESTTFQTILNGTRLDLARHYLAQNDISPDEISYLLGFRDSNSFYRAFRAWTGETPLQFRQSGGRSGPQISILDADN